MLNTVILGMTWFDEPREVTKFVEIMNLVFMVIFTLEAALKITALKKAYFKDSWNVFDFIIVILTLSILFLKAL